MSAASPRSTGGPNSVLRATSLLEAASASSAHPGEAVDLARRARDMFVKLGHRSGEGRARMVLGTAYKQRGELRRAEEELRTALAIAQESRELKDEGDVANALAGVLRWMGDRGEEALGLYELALETAEGGGRVFILANMAGLPYERGEFAQAEAGYRVALGAVPEGEEPPAILRFNLATAIQGTGRYEAALEMYEEVIRAMSGRGDRLLVEARVGAARCALMLGDVDAAFAWLEPAIAQAELLRTRAGAPSARTAMFGLLLDAYRVSATACVLRNSPGDLSRSFELTERCRARELADRLSTDPSGRLAQEGALASADAELTTTLRRIQSINAGPSPDAELSAVLEARRRAIEEALEQASSAVAGSRDLPLEGATQVFDGEAVCAALPDGVVLVEYQLGKDHTVIWWAKRQELRADFVPLKGSQLADLVDAAVGAYSTGLPDERTATDMATRVERLKEILLHPIRAELDGATSVVVVPDGALHRLPFHLLLDDLPVTVAPSATIAIQPRRRREAFDVELLAIGDPRIDRNDPLVGWLEPLPGTGAEARRIAELFGAGGKSLVRDDAHVDNFLQWAPRARFVHLATHGLHDPKDPRASGLVLAPSLRTDGSRTSGLLGLPELARLRVPAELVVLSACDSGVGSLQAGEGNVGLAWGLLAAGVRVVVATKWAVRDIVALMLMLELYRRIQTGAAPAAALHAARRSIRARHPDPYFWAAFELVGSVA